jgi:hypothetical protein
MKLLLFCLFTIITLQVQAQEKVTFTLHNTSAKSIPLIIPTVMNPNLSPFSKSGVTTRVGQEIFFRYQGKKRLLLKVSATNAKETINVPLLLKERKAAIRNKRAQKE